MDKLKENIALFIIGSAYLVFTGYFIWKQQYYMTLVPFALMVIYHAVFNTEKVFLSLAFFTPLSVNIEQYTKGFGLYLPTEPLLFGLMLLLLFQQFRTNVIDNRIFKNRIIQAVGIYLIWIAISAAVSTDVAVSYKFLLSKLWFIVPLLLFGTRIFYKPQNIRTFIWLYIIGMAIVAIYTLSVHATYSFREVEGHWVMWPFFKDHTIYGCMLAFVTPLVFGLFISKKNQLAARGLLLAFIVLILVALFFSSSRAAWLSVIISLLVLLVIKLKIKLKYLITFAGIALVWLYFSWGGIMRTLEENKFEHTTEDFAEKLQSATNVTTDASNLERLNRWACAIDMFYEQPIWGFGPGTYAFNYARFQKAENLTIISTNFGNAGNAHSEYLGALSEMGFLGFVSVILIVIAIFYKSITLYYRWPKKDKEMRTILLSMIMALVTYFVHGALNNYLDTDKAAVPIWAFCAAFVALEMYLNASEEEIPEDLKNRLIEK